MIVNYNEFKKKQLEHMINEMKAVSFRYSIFKLNNTDNLKFSLLIFEARMEKRIQVVKELKKVFDIEKYIEEYIKCSIAQIEIYIYESVGNGGEHRTSIRFERLGYGSSEGPYITIDDFLEVGIYNIEEYFEMQKNVNKYNL
jgi:hypothetical protein